MRGTSEQSTAPIAGENPERIMQEFARQKRWKEAAGWAQELTIKSPLDPIPWYWLGAARLQLQDSLGAVQAFRPAEKLGLDTALLHEGLGLAYYDLNQFYLFEQQMEKASKQDPQDAMPYFYLGRYREIVRSDFKGALEFFNQAVRLRPDDARSLYHQGNCLEQLQRQQQARECYAEAIRIVEKSNEAFAWPYQGMARLLLEEQPSAALHWAQKAVEIEPKEYRNHVLLAKVLQRLGSLSEALREAQTAAELNPASSTVRYTLFKLYREAGDQKASQAELEMFQKLKTIYGPE
jgi:tetratricopeptide (TPR) repeat protein